MMTIDAGSADEEAVDDAMGAVEVADDLRSVLTTSLTPRLRALALFAVGVIKNFC